MESKVLTHEHWLLHIKHWARQSIRGQSRRAPGIMPHWLTIGDINIYREPGISEAIAIPVAGRASCGCVYHAEDGIPCEHDLVEVGL